MFIEELQLKMVETYKVPDGKNFAFFRKETYVNKPKCWIEGNEYKFNDTITRIEEHYCCTKIYAV